MSKKEGFELEEVSIRLVKETTEKKKYKIQSPGEAVEFVADKIRMLDREVICVINLKASGEPINFSIVSMGILDEALANPREILKSSILSNAANMIMLHNHPSGNLIPSSADVKLTDRMIKVCDLVSIPLLDHIIVGPEFEDEYYSFNKKDRIKHINTLTSNIDNISFSQEKVAEQGIVEEYRNRTKEFFHPINEVFAENFEDTVYYYINSILEEDYPAIEMVDVVLVGSRSRGIEGKNSDMDFAFEYMGEMHEDELFNILNGNNFKILGIDIDINPIRREETGTLEDYLPKAEHYLQEKKQKMANELIDRCKSIVNTHGYPIIGNDFVSFPEEYDDVFTKDELKKLEKTILEQKNAVSLRKAVKATNQETTPKRRYISEPVSTGPRL